MGQCRKPQCNSQMAAGSAYCALHKGGPNVVLPSVPVSVAVRQARTPAPRAAAPHHRRRGAVDFGTTAPLLDGQAKNMQRMRFAHATHLAKRTTDKESLAPLIAAFHEIAQAPGFAKCLDDEVGWTNWSAWCDWAVRA